MLELFRVATYRWLFVSNMAFFLAMQSQALVRGFLAFRLTGSEFALGGVSFAVAVPMLLVSPIGGVLADRVDRRRLILAAQGLVLVNESTVLTLYVTGRLEFWHLVGGSARDGLRHPADDARTPGDRRESGRARASLRARSRST